MLLLSPGLASLLYGVSSIPGAKQEHGTIWTAQVVVFTIIGVLLVAAFVPWALSARNQHPLVDLHLFRDRAMTIAIVAMALFAVAFFGAGLLFPLYFQQVLGHKAMGSGLLLIPQGVGAVLTMPSAGVLSDKIGPGKVVMTGIVLDTIGLAFFIHIGSDPSTLRILAGLFVMGLGMGATMMPMFSAALATLKHEQIARGSTLMNVTQQVAASIGTAIFSVILTNGFVSRAGSALAIAGSNQHKVDDVLAKFQLTHDQIATVMKGAIVDFGDAFGSVFLIGTILVGLCFIPAMFLPRSKVAHLDEEAEAAVMIGH